MGLALYLSKDFNTMIALSDKIFHVSRIALGGLVYFLAAYLLKSPELSSIQILLKRLFKKQNA